MRRFIFAVVGLLGCSRGAAGIGTDNRSDNGPDNGAENRNSRLSVESAATNVAAADPRLDHELVGSMLPEWRVSAWVNSKPLRLVDLRGRVVLVRWFRGPSCPFCSATAPALRALYNDFVSRGLVVIGMFDDTYGSGDDAPTPTPATPVNALTALAARYQFSFPVAHDEGLRTLELWWTGGYRRERTSVSFLLDRRGRIRGVHQGGRYALGDPDYLAVRHAVEVLIAEQTAAPDGGL